MATTDAGLDRFLVEWYGPRAPTRSIDETADRINDGATSTSALGAQIRLLMALAVPAESVETAARVCADAGAPAERISAAIGWSNTRDY